MTSGLETEWAYYSRKVMDRKKVKTDKVSKKGKKWKEKDRVEYGKVNG